MTENKKRGRVGVVSALIDPLLLEGGRRVNEMADIVVQALNGQYTKAKIVNNIRSRMTVLTKSGYVIERDAVERRRIKLVLVVSPPVVE